MTRLRGFHRIVRPCLSPAGLAILVSVVAPSARAAEASAWVKGAQSQARLVDGGRDPVGGKLLAGLEIRLEPHFITYWRDPGDAGVPPTFSFAGSRNLKAATVRYPGPRKLDEAGAAAFGYEDAVTFPIDVEAVDPKQPVDIALSLDYAACHDICLPAHADLRLSLDGRPSADAACVQAALRTVPRPSTIGASGGPPAVLAVTPVAAGGFTVSAAVGADPAALFVEAPEGWAFAAGDPHPDGAGRVVFPVKRLDHPTSVETPPAPLVLTLTTGAGAIEVPVKLDAMAPKP